MRRFVVVMVAVLFASCSEQVTLPRQNAALTDDLKWARFNDDAFLASQPEAAFWAVRGDDRDLVLRYSDSGDAYLRFTVDRDALSERPDGTPFAEGDSVLITVQAHPNGKWMFHFEPSGLKFNPQSPATLAFIYDRSDAADAVDPKVWKRELPAVPWQPLQSRRPVAKVVEASIYDFTDFGIAIN